MYDQLYLGKGVWVGGLVVHVQLRAAAHLCYGASNRQRRPTSNSEESAQTVGQVERWTRSETNRCSFAPAAAAITELLTSHSAFDKLLNPFPLSILSVF